MSYEKPPTLDDFNEIIPEKPRAATPAQKGLRLLLALLAVVALALGVMNLATSDLTATLRGTGGIQGTAINGDGAPFAADIFVEGTRISGKAQADGTFEVRNIPVGKHLVVIASAGSGVEIPVDVAAGEMTNLGQVRLQPTATP